MEESHKRSIESCHDAEMSSLAASSALVSESILDSPTAEFSYPPDTSVPPSADCSTHSTDERGVARHSFSPGRISAILSQIQQESPDDEPDSDAASMIHPSHYHAYLNEQKKRAARRQSVPPAGMPAGTPADSLVQQPPEDKDGAELPLGIIASTRKWLAGKKARRQIDALKQAVEDQRRILVRENLRMQMMKRGEFRKSRSLDHSAFDGAGLRSNQTFQSITGEGSHSIASEGASLAGASVASVASVSSQISSHTRSLLDMNLYLCGSSQVVEQDESQDGSRAADHADYADGLGVYNCTFSSDQPLHAPSDEIYYDDIDTQKPASDEEVIRIGNLHETISGEGMSVQLEIVDSMNPPTIEIDHQEALTIQKEENDIPFILAHEQLLAIAQIGLPPSVLFSKWKRLYSLLRDGDSFEAAFLPNVHGHTRTLLIIQTTNHEVMAAYSSSAWENTNKGHTPQFYGSAQACLFSIDKTTQKLTVFKWSGANRYIQVCNVHSKMLAFGGGGTEGEFGLCVENDFSTGSTGPCETFRNEPLCTQDQFDVMNVECWGFMPVFS